MERYYWYLWHDHFCVVEVREDGYATGMDFFSLDYYADHYSLPELRELVAQMREEIIGKNSEEEKIKCVEEFLKRNRKNMVAESDNIYFGLDNSEIRNSYQREHFIPKGLVFPLKTVIWEGEYFRVPNDAEEFLTYEFEHPWEFPEDVGIPSHFKELNGDT